VIAGKRILLLSPFQAWPMVNGTITRTYYLAKHLSRRNELFFVYRGPGQAEPLEFEHHALPNMASRPGQLFNPALLRRLHRLISSEQIDLILTSHLWAGLHGSLLKRMSNCPLIHDHHNVEFDRFRQVGNRVWPAVKILEKNVCRTADQVVSVSETDRQKLLDHFTLKPERVVVLENGADVNALRHHAVDVQATRQRLGLPLHGPLLLFFGSMTYAPNIQALENLRNYVIPELKTRLDDFTVAVAGAGLIRSKAKGEHLRVLGFVDDILALIKSADLVIAPLSAGSGTRFKIIESVACGKRVVSTSIGAEGLDRCAFGDTLHIADAWSAFADQAARLVSDKSNAEIPSSFEETYDWQHITDRLHLPTLQG
jgi:glycosyltransferase involved in cell wall biosynthesis